MNHISILIVDDDLNKISSIIRTIREVFNETLSITQASCVQEAIENLQKKEYHLLITDLQMPLKYDDSPNNQAGQSLINSIYRKRTKANVPIYIVGLTQFEELKLEFRGVWKVWHYNSINNDWKINLRDLIFHISLIKSRIVTNKIETIFVEGPTDKKIIEATIKHFYSDLSDKVYIDTINFGGGASWVERQLFIWAKSLLSNPIEENYLKAVGVFDNDEAGNKAIEKLRSLVDPDSAESKTFSIVKSSFKYSPLLKTIKLRGISFPTTIEDLVSIDCWRIAEKNGWLENREVKKIKIDNTLLDLNLNDLNIETLKQKQFDDFEILMITKKISDNFKTQFCKMVCESDDSALISIKYLIEEIFEKLRVKIIA